MNDTFSPLEEQLNLDYLQKHSNQAEEAFPSAIANSENYQILASEYQKLEAENAALKAKLVATSNKLREKQIRLQVEKVELCIKNQRLLNLAKFLYVLTFVSLLVLLFS